MLGTCKESGSTMMIAYRDVGPVPVPPLCYQAFVTLISPISVTGQGSLLNGPVSLSCIRPSPLHSPANVTEPLLVMGHMVRRSHNTSLPASRKSLSLSLFLSPHWRISSSSLHRSSIPDMQGALCDGKGGRSAVFYCCRQRC